MAGGKGTAIRHKSRPRIVVGILNSFAAIDRRDFAHLGWGKSTGIEELRRYFALSAISHRLPLSIVVSGGIGLVY